jgi:hypothetical protein
MFCWATFWATFSQTHLVTLLSIEGNPERVDPRQSG